MPYTALQEAIAAVIWSNWALVLVGIAGVCAALRTLAAISDQTSLLRDSTKAARRSAIAAIQNLTAFKDKERARISIEPGEVNLPDGSEHITYKVFCYGTTPAFILDSRVSAKITKSEIPDDDAQLHSSTSFPSVIQPTVVGVEKIAFIFDLSEGNAFQEIQDAKMFVHLYGAIRYRDIFESERVTTFRYVYGILGFGILLPGPPGWSKCGTPEDNRET